MDNNPHEVTDNGIVVESVEDDMVTHGIEVPESKQEEASAAEPEAKEEEHQKPKRKPRTQRKIETQARKLKEKDEIIAAQAAQLKERESNPIKDKEEVLEIEAPSVDDFEDYSEFEEAQEAYKEAKAVAKTKAADTTPEKITESEPEATEQPQMTDSLRADVQDMAEDGAESYDDFKAVLENEDFPLTVPVLNEITAQDNAADVTYYLGTHLDEALDIAKMSNKERAREIMRISIELETKPVKKARVSNAPDPINPVGGGNSAISKTLDSVDTSFEEHEQILNGQHKRTPGGFL